MLIYDICFSPSDLLHSLWWSLGPPTSLGMRGHFLNKHSWHQWFGGICARHSLGVFAVHAPRTVLREVVPRVTLGAQCHPNHGRWPDGTHRVTWVQSPTPVFSRRFSCSSRVPWTDSGPVCRSPPRVSAGSWEAFGLLSAYSSVSQAESFKHI